MNEQARVRMILFSLRFLVLRAISSSVKAIKSEHVCDPKCERDYEERKLREHRLVITGPELRHRNDKKNRRNIREINADILAFCQRAIVRVGPEMKVDVEQKRIGKGDTDNGDSVSKSQQRGPGVRTQIEETVQRDNEITGMPATHCEREQCQDRSIFVSLLR